MIVTMIIVINDAKKTMTQNIRGIVVCCDGIVILAGVGVSNTGGGNRPVTIK